LAKTRTIFVCQQCGAQQSRWMGKCPDCGTWDSLVEQVERKEVAGKYKGPAAASGLNQPQPLREVPLGGFARLPVLGNEFARVLGGGLVPGSLVLIGGDPGIGKCVVGTTRVLDPISGAFRPITEWATRVAPVLALNEATYQLMPQEEVAFHNQGVRSVIEVITRLGRRLRCTPNHPILTPDGWRPIGELHSGARVAAPRSLPHFGNETMAEHEIKLVAYMLSDGSAHTSIGVTSAIPEVEADLLTIAQHFGMELRVYPKSKNKAKQYRFVIAEKATPVARLLESVGLHFTRADNKAIPNRIFCLPKEQLALFLKILFTCDGSVYITKNGIPGLSYSTISERLAQDIQHLLLRFGFIAKLRTKQQKVNGEPYTAYELQMLGVAEVRRFLHEIGIWGREEAKAKIEQMQLPTLSSTHFNTVPTGERFWGHLREVIGGISLKVVSAKAGVTIRNRRHERLLTRSTVAAIADAYPSAYLRSLAYGDIYWDEIESITPAGEERVYDLTVPGAANFVANDLIVHNSTLMLQAAGDFANTIGQALYVSAEESTQQIKLRAMRMGLDPERLLVYSETNLDAILEQINNLRPQLVVVDSIQTVYLEDLTAAAGSVSQVREGALRLLRMAKDTGVPIFLVGHVTKEGAIAGPRVLEHIVDVVLYLEGERFHQYRLLRGVKNRFGSTDEVGVFEMTQDGLREVPNPSQVFLAERSAGTPGSAVAVTMEGTRPLLVEVQALTANTTSAQPRRTANGFDMNRLLMLIAVLSKRVGLPLFNQDIYVNIVGGLRITEPAADLAVAIAIASSYRNQRVRQDLVLVGEIGLSGELRSTGQLERRLGEAAKLGFKRSVYPRTAAAPKVDGLSVAEVRSVADAVDIALERGDERRPAAAQQPATEDDADVHDDSP
jgi:DNA repair protein RadA/Sms